MKYRTHFVSNSSTSSFMIPLDKITRKQIKQIISHKIKCRHHGMSCRENEEWEITETDEVLMGRTWMDNFDMQYFINEVGVNMNDVKWGEWGDFIWPESGVNK